MDSIEYSWGGVATYIPNRSSKLPVTSPYSAVTPPSAWVSMSVRMGTSRMCLSALRRTGVYLILDRWTNNEGQPAEHDGNHDDLE